MKTSLKLPGLALIAAVGVAVAGCSSTSIKPPATPASTDASHILSVDLKSAGYVFVSASGTSSPYPAGPLSPGDRVIGQDDLTQHGTTVGTGFETCTVNFGLNIPCDYMAELTDTGDLHLAWTFQWPASGTGGPLEWDGVLDGGTGRYADTIGTFHAQALPDRDINVTVRMVHPS